MPHGILRQASIVLLAVFSLANHAQAEESIVGPSAATAGDTVLFSVPTTYTKVTVQRQLPARDFNVREGILRIDSLQPGTYVIVAYDQSGERLEKFVHIMEGTSAPRNSDKHVGSVAEDVATTGLSFARFSANDDVEPEGEGVATSSPSIEEALVTLRKLNDFKSERKTFLDIVNEARAQVNFRSFIRDAVADKQLNTAWDDLSNAIVAQNQTEFTKKVNEILGAAPLGSGASVSNEEVFKENVARRLVASVDRIDGRFSENARKIAARWRGILNEPWPESQEGIASMRDKLADEFGKISADIGKTRDADAQVYWDDWQDEILKLLFLLEVDKSQRAVGFRKKHFDEFLTFTPWEPYKNIVLEVEAPLFERGSLSQQKKAFVNLIEVLEGTAKAVDALERPKTGAGPAISSSGIPHWYHTICKGCLYRQSKHRGR